MIDFDDIPREIWIKYKDKDSFDKDEQNLYKILEEYDGKTQVCIYLECEKAIKILPKNRSVKAEVSLLDKLSSIYSKENIKVVEKSIEKSRKKIRIRVIM